MSGEACNQLISGSCPARSGERFTFRYAYTVPQAFPIQSSIVTSRVWHDDGDIAICIQLDVMTVA